MAAPGAVVGVARRALWRVNGALKACDAPGVPSQSKGAVSFAELTLVLGQARAAPETTKAALAAEAERQAPAKTSRAPEEEAALRRRLAEMMVRLAASPIPAPYTCG